MAVTALMIWQGIGIAPDRYVFVLLLGSLLIKRTRSFILDWLPFLFILISYDFLRGLAPFLNTHVNYQTLIDMEMFIFGLIPTIYLQGQFLHLPNLSWYDYLTTIFYFLHFALPLGFGFLLWIDNKAYFKQFVVAISLLSYAAWATFVVFPASPPWLSSQKGYLPEVTKILDYTLGAFPVNYELPTLYHRMNPNPVAAIPSLHGAYPFLVFLFCLYFFKWKGLLFLPYVLSMWVSMVYLGEHYVVDLLAGALYATTFFLATIFLKTKIKWLNT